MRPANSRKVMKFEIKKQQDNIINYLRESQKPNGEFESLESYPEDHPEAQSGWRYTDPSPFIHANIIYSLMQIKQPQTRLMVEKGIAFIKSLQENKCFWRFWPHGGQTHNVPLDMDDTCLCSVILEKNGYNLNNKKILLANQDERGTFNTWILPRRPFIKFPAFYWFLRKDLKKIRPILDSEMLDQHDTEPGVAANVLLYLGKNPATFKSIGNIILQVKENEFPLQYYHDPLYTYFHISRAFFAGISSFIELKNVIIRSATDRLENSNSNIFEKIISLLCILNFGEKDHFMISPTIDKILEFSKENEWQSFAYFTSKDKNFRAGSPCLTASFALEALTKSLRPGAV